MYAYDTAPARVARPFDYVRGFRKPTGDILPRPCRLSALLYLLARQFRLRAPLPLSFLPLLPIFRAFTSGEVARTGQEVESVKSL